MLNLHFVFGTHFNEHLAIPVADKMQQLKSKNVVFIGSEGAGLLNHERKSDEEAFNRGKKRTELSLSAKELSASRSQWTPSFIRLKTREMKASAPDTFERGHAIQSELLDAIGISYGIPVRRLEYARRRKAKIINKLLGVTDFDSSAKTGVSFTSGLQRFKEKLFSEVNVQKARHEVVVKNLARLGRPHANEDAHAVIVFGDAHHGMETWVARELTKRGVPARVGSVSTTRQSVSLRDELIERMYADKSYKPSEDEITRAFFHAIISTSIINTIAFSNLPTPKDSNDVVRLLGGASEGMEKTMNTLNDPVISQLIAKTKMAIKGMTKQEILSTTTQSQTLKEFLLARLPPKLAKNLKMPEKISSLKLEFN